MKYNIDSNMKIERVHVRTNAFKIFFYARSLFLCFDNTLFRIRGQ